MRLYDHRFRRPTLLCCTNATTAATAAAAATATIATIATIATPRRHVGQLFRHQALLLILDRLKEPVRANIVMMVVVRMPISFDRRVPSMEPKRVWLGFVRNLTQRGGSLVAHFRHAVPF